MNRTEFIIVTTITTKSRLPISFNALSVCYSGSRTIKFNPSVILRPSKTVEF